jgi:hypothetical protein
MNVFTLRPCASARKYVVLGVVRSTGVGTVISRRGAEARSFLQCRLLVRDRLLNRVRPKSDDCSVSSLVGYPSERLRRISFDDKRCECGVGAFTIKRPLRHVPGVEALLF